MMAGNPNNLWSSLHTQGHHHHQLPPNFLSESPAAPVFPLQYFHGSASSPFPGGTLHPLVAAAGDHGQEYPLSWSQLLLGGLANNADGEADHRFSPNHFQPRKLGTWDHNMNPISASHSEDDRVREEENRENSISYRHEDHEVLSGTRASPWPQILPASSPPKSCVTSSLNSSILDFSSSNKATQWNQHADNSSECNSTAIGGASKKARVQPSSTSSLKVRKEKLGDRITTLHQLVSPFGKTDTASVLLEAIGYIRFLQGQIEALSSPYMEIASDKSQHPVSNISSLSSYNFTCFHP
ncbi:Transcription factor bHLH68-like protein [Drosera capensis]